MIRVARIRWETGVAMNAASIAGMKLSVEVITLPVSDVKRALLCRPGRLHARRRLSPNDAFRVAQLTPPESSCTIQIGSGPTDAPVESLRNVYLVVTDLEAARRLTQDCETSTKPKMCHRNRRTVWWHHCYSILSISLLSFGVTAACRSSLNSPLCETG